MLFFWKLVNESQMPHTQDFRNTFKQILACIFLSVRVNSKSSFQYEALCSYIFFLISGEFAKFKATIGYMEMGGDDHDKDGKYSFDEFKTVVKSHQGSYFVFNIFSHSSQVFSHERHWQKNNWIQKLVSAR